MQLEFCNFLYGIQKKHPMKDGVQERWIEILRRNTIIG